MLPDHVLISAGNGASIRTLKYLLLVMSERMIWIEVEMDGIEMLIRRVSTKDSWTWTEPAEKVPGSGKISLTSNEKTRGSSGVVPGIVTVTCGQADYQKRSNQLTWT